MLKQNTASRRGPDRSADLLDRIAEALDCPVSAFAEGQAPSDPSQTAELLRLWAMIEPEEDRAKVLSFLRSIVAQSSLTSASNSLSQS